MKLKTLKIHNIASIEDATIEFDGPVLSKQDLFLICGPTGSGKSTLLDAVCLVLFGTTPRTEQTENTPINPYDNVNADEKDPFNQTKSIVHLVRKQAIDASVVLTFETDGHCYTASWRARRKGQFNAGKESSTFAKMSLEDKLRLKLLTEWTLTDDEGRVYKNNLKTEIPALIKMNFDQFCKTTMLAQGDFTKFLESKGSEKAKILEKLVGTQKYAEVGKVINQNMRDKKSAFDLLSKELENFPILSDEEREAKGTEINHLDTEISTIAKQIEEIDYKVKWIEDKAKAVRDMEKAVAQQKEAQSGIDSPQAKAMQHTLQLWDDTTELRKSLASAIECNDNAKRLKQQSSLLAQDYDKCMGGLIYIEDAANKLKNENINLSTYLQKQEKYSQMYSNANIICEKHKKMCEDVKFIEEETPKLQALQQDINEYNKMSIYTEVFMASCNSKIDNWEEAKADLNKKLDTYAPNSILADMQSLHAHKKAVENIENAIKELSNAIANKQDLAEKTDNAKENLALKEKQAIEAQSKFETAEAKAKKSKEALDTHASMLDDFVIGIRAKLHTGDTCPVCGNKVGKLLLDEEIRRSLKPFEEQAKADQKEVDTASKALIDAKGLLIAAKKELDKMQSESTNAESALNKAEKALSQHCSNLGINPISDLNSQIEEIKKEDAAKEAAIDVRQEEIKNISAEIKSIDDTIKKMRNGDLAQADSNLKIIKDDLKKFDNEKAIIEGAIMKANENIKQLENEIDELKNPEWAPMNVKDYFVELLDAANEYAKASKDYDDNGSKIDALTTDMQIIKSCQEQILTLIPAWREAQLPIASAIASPTQQWTKLATAVDILRAGIEANNDKAKRAKSEIEAFQNAYPQINIDEVQCLLQLPLSTISNYRNSINTLTQALSNAKALHKEASERLEAYAKSPLQEGETKEKLSIYRNALSEKSSSYSEQKGRLSQALETDNENRRLQGEKKEKLVALSGEYSEWEFLNRYLGSTDGKNFRDVAQSFILAELLDKANEYLANISDRYKLYCNPGTLVIMMKDTQQWGVSRPTNTLSGGESFIVSLALALGLSSMQNVDFEVDTLFIDEGFGTLSPEFLDPVVTALKKLHEKYGRRVGIISHVDSLKQRIPVSIVMEKHGTRSTVNLKVN